MLKFLFNNSVSSYEVHGLRMKTQTSALISNWSSTADFERLQLSKRVVAKLQPFKVLLNIFFLRFHYSSQFISMHAHENSDTAIKNEICQHEKLQE